MRYYSLIAVHFFVQFSYAQPKLTGKIIDAVTKQPISNVSVYLSHTTIGTTSNEKGEFTIVRIPPGKFDLIATSLNYENYISTIGFKPQQEPLLILMRPADNTLEEVIVEPYDKDGWIKWGSYFKTHFIGNFSLVKNCKLVNPDVVKFRFNSKKNSLRAFAYEKLIFENRSLGYRIKYLLTRFELDFSANTFKYVGYPLFENLAPKNPAEKKRWDSARANIYRGSLRHFLRSLFSNQLSPDGFEVRVIKNITPQERERVADINRIYDQMQDAGLKPRLRIAVDSFDYYKKIRDLADSNNTIVINKLIPRDSLVSVLTGTKEEAETMFFQFPGMLHISYLHKPVPYDYSGILLKVSNKDCISSEIGLLYGKGITIYRNGNYFNGENLLIDGYWSWSEKLCTMLPSDYWPDEKNN